MIRCIVLVAGALSVLGLAAGVESQAGPFFHRREGTPPPGAPRAFEHTQARAGDPLCLSPHAAPTRTPAYDGYYVGGGTGHGGDSRRREEGTWGTDYVGTWLPGNVFLGWSHGRRYQGGTGSYTTDRIESPDKLGAVINDFRFLRRRPSESEESW